MEMREHLTNLGPILVGSLLAALLVLAGCAPREVIVYEPIEVLVPVTVPPPAPPPAVRPELPIDALLPTAPPADVARAYAATVILLMEYARELEVYLDVYRRP